MRLASVRSGLQEAFDDVAAIALDTDDTVLFASGPVDREMFYRSSIKPLQAIAARRLGLELCPEHLALACASHGGYPVHLAIVEFMLTNHGLTLGDLRCPPGRPLSHDAEMYQIQRGRYEPEPRFHMCSGKHAAWLAACVSADLDTRTYLDPNHPLQVSILETVQDYSDADARPVGVDGCGAPTLRGTLTTLGRSFAKLSNEAEAKPVASAMTTYGALVADNLRPDGRVALWWDGPSKGGAQGSFAMARNGVAIATKSASGSSIMAVAGALHVAERIGMLPEGMASGLKDEISPPVFGAGRRVGRTIVIDQL